MKKVKNLKWGSKVVATLVVASLLGTSGCSFRLHKDSEIKRVKRYLEDFKTTENYVDLSKVSSDYDIENFSGEALYQALQDVDVDYVRITDNYIYDENHVLPFRTVTGVNYDVILGYDDEDKPVYEMYEPIRIPTSEGVTYDVPESYELDTIEVIANPLRYEDLMDKEIEVYDNEYEKSKSLVLK